MGNRQYAESLIQPIFDATLPHLERVYRENFNTVIKFHVISTKEELAAILKEIWNQEIAVAELSAPVCMMEVRYAFWLLRPGELAEFVNARDFVARGSG